MLSMDLRRTATAAVIGVCALSVGVAASLITGPLPMFDAWRSHPLTLAMTPADLAPTQSVPMTATAGEHAPVIGQGVTPNRVPHALPGVTIPRVHTTPPPQMVVPTPATPTTEPVHTTPPTAPAITTTTPTTTTRKAESSATSPIATTPATATTTAPPTPQRSPTSAPATASSTPPLRSTTLTRYSPTAP